MFCFSPFLTSFYVSVCSFCQGLLIFLELMLLLIVFLDFVFFDFAETELNCAIAVRVLRLVANDNVVAALDDRHGDNFALVGENLRHAEFNA